MKRVPEMPEGYRDGVLPPMPLRTTIMHVSVVDGGTAPAGIQPPAAEMSHDGRLIAHDQESIDLMLQEGRQRDDLADAALADILGSMSGKPLTAELLHSVRLRVRKLADEVHALTRVAAAFISQRERIRGRCKVDPANIVSAVKAKVAAGTSVSDAFVELADELIVAPETIRNAYYKHRVSQRK